MGLVVAIMNSVAEATIDFMTQDSTRARKHCKDSFETLWRVVARLFTWILTRQTLKEFMNAESRFHEQFVRVQGVRHHRPNLWD
jgi:diacylglycerol kinase